MEPSYIYRYIIKYKYKIAKKYTKTGKPIYKTYHEDYDAYKITSPLKCNKYYWLLGNNSKM